MIGKVPRTRQRRPVRPVELAGVFLCALLALLVLQWRFGAWERELAFHPDESAHYVTGVMVSEYLRAGTRQHPLYFAEQYYLRYPRLALGHWPPLFPAALGVWILAFGPERLAVFACMALLAAGAATALYRLVRFVAPAGWAAAAAIWWLLFQRQTQVWAGSVITEIPFTLLCLTALLAYVSYLKTPRWRPAALFGAAAAAALLTKGLGIVLAFVPFPAVLAVRRADLLRRWSFWLPAGVVLALAGPWYALQGSVIPTAFGGAWQRLTIARLGSTKQRFSFLSEFLGPWEFPAAVVMLAAAAAVLAALPAIRRSGRCSPVAAVCGAYVAAGLFLHAVLPESAEPRHLFHLIPVLIGGAAVGLARLSQLLPVWTAAPGRLALAAVVAVRLGWPDAQLDKTDFALKALVEQWAADPSLDGTVFLAAANGNAEGALIAEAARLSPDPQWFVLRSSKSLAWVNWAPQGEYVRKFETAADIAAYLDSIPVAIVVISLGQYETLPHDRLLLEALESHPERWRPYPERFSRNRPYSLRAFRSTRPNLLPRKPIRMDLTRRLGRVIEAPPVPSLRSQD